MISFKQFLKEESVQLQEVHFTDEFPQGFTDFHNKWKKRKNEYGLYVRFDNGDSIDSLAKGSVSDPDHKDPIGTYAYPLKYVIDHPGDIWYGHNSKFIKVIKDKAKKKVVLSSMSYGAAETYVRRAGLGSTDVAKGYYPERAKGITAPGKLFMSMVQMDFSDAHSPRDIKQRYRRNDSEIKEPQVRSGKEQTEILLKMGIDAVEDQAKNIGQASINDREPEQIVWLRPQAFEILETFRLSDVKQNRSSVVLDTDKLQQKLVALIATAMKDKLIDDPVGGNFAKKYWTRDGRKIEVSDYDSTIDYRMKNLKMGQKKHKMLKKGGKDGLKAKVFTERGDFNLWVTNEEKIQNVVDSFVQQWNEKKDENNGKKYSKKQHEAEVAAEKKAYYEKVWAEEKADNIDTWNTKIVGYFNKLAEKLNLPLISKDFNDPDIINVTYKAMPLQKETIEKMYDNKADMTIVDSYQEMLKGFDSDENTKGLRVSRRPERSLYDLLTIYNLHENI